jgi:plastocyanin
VKKLLALAAAGSAAAALGVPALAATTKTVKVADDYFVRRGATPTVRIHKGDTVRWVWSGRHRHNVFQIGGPGHFHSPTHARTGTFRHRFTVRGTYVFQCTYHAKMRMKLRVG